MPTSSAVERSENEGPDSFLGSTDLAVLLRHLTPFGCLDIGARGGVIEDIRPLGGAAHVYGFEPDEVECSRLNDRVDRSGHRFGKLRYLPVALGPKAERRTLHIMRHEGASSLLSPDPEITERFGERADYFDVARTATIDTAPLDRVIVDHGLTDIVYMKIDVEGFELEILKGAERLLGSDLLALRAEVAFLPCRIGQPDFGELATYLKSFHLIPMGFLYLANWRSLTTVKYPRKIGGPIPFSRGQTVHGDVLFLRDPSTLDDGSDRAIDAKLRLACLALLYDYVDVAYDVFRQPAVSARLQNVIGSDGLNALSKASQFLARRHDRRALRTWGRNLMKRVAFEVRHAFV